MSKRKNSKIPKNGNIHNHLRAELNSVLAEFKKRKIADLFIDVSPPKKGNENYIYRAKSREDKKVWVEGECKDQHYAKEKLLLKLKECLKMKKGKQEIDLKIADKKKLYQAEMIS